VRVFAVGDAVGVRTNATKQRTKKVGVHNIPALIVAARDNVRVGGATVGQRLYTCLTKYGVIERQIKVDGLTYVSSGNYPALYSRFREQLADGSWQYMRRVTMETARQAWLEEREPASRTEPARQQQRRSAKDAMDDEKGELGEVELNDGDDDEGDEVKEEAAEQKAQSSSRLPMSHPVRILRQSRLRYQVLWNDPPGEKTWESVKAWDSRAEYRDLVLAFRARAEEEGAEEEDLEL
jgi:hypothetical protein